MKNFLLFLSLFLSTFLISNAQNTLEACDNSSIVCESRSLRSTTYNLLRTNHGYVQIGPASSKSSFAHFNTDKAKFYFNKDIYTRTGGFSSYSGRNLFLKTNGDTRLTIMSSNGFVGIGTKNPEARLDINGNVKINTDLNVLGNSTVQQNMSVNQGLEVKGGLSLHNLDTSTTPNSSPLLSISENGMVSKFTMAQIQTNMYKEPKPCIPDSEGNYPKATWSNNGDNPNPVLYTAVNCPSKVGIGTANPHAKLHVNGNAKIRLGLEVGDANIDDSKLNVRGDAIFDKNVAIGTDIQKGFDLAVCGKIRATEIKVNAASEWCDYVFEEDYDLRDLSEVDAFIKENKHLPEIPSGVEVETEGIAVSEMMLLMMKKIEELTLYTIEQEKRIEELENK